MIGGKALVVNGLPLIFDHVYKQGLRPGPQCDDRLLETVHIYHAIEAAEERAYRDALAHAYEDYCQRRSKTDSAGEC